MERVKESVNGDLEKERSDTYGLSECLIIAHGDGEERGV